MESGTVVSAAKSFSTLMVKTDPKEMVKITSAIGKFLDAVSVGQFVGGSLIVDTPNIKAKRQLIDTSKDLASVGSSGSGVALDKSTLAAFASYPQLTANTIAISTNIHKGTDHWVDTNKTTGTVTIDIKSGYTPLKVTQTPLIISLTLGTSKESDMKCVFWTGEGFSSEGCKPMGIFSGETTFWDNSASKYTTTA